MKQIDEQAKQGRGNDGQSELIERTRRRGNPA